MPNDNHNPLDWIDAALDDLQRTGLRRRLAVRSGAQTASINLDGKDLVNFGSNDYLGLANDERLTEAARRATDREGWGSGASPLVSGRSKTHAELERRLAKFEGTVAALVFPSGFAANAGIIPALVEEPDAIFGDAKNHASLIDGCRLSKAARFVYPHCDCDALETMLRDAGQYRRRLIVTDTVFSMDGDIAPLARLADLAEQYDAMLMVDEAHATGVFGPNGRGVTELLDSLPLPRGEPASNLPLLLGEGTKRAPASPTPHPASSPHIRVGTLSKALGCAGGFVCGSQSLIDWLANRARTYVFSTAQPPATYAAALSALDIVRDEPHRRTQLLENAANLRTSLRDQGWKLSFPLPSGEPISKLPLPCGEGWGAGTCSQIIPLIIGDANRTMQLAARLREARFFIPGIRPPSVPEGESLLRLSLCFHHTPEMIDALLKQLACQRACPI